MPTGKTQNTCLSRHGQSLLGPHRVPLTESAVEQTGFVFALPSAADAAEKKNPSACWKNRTLILQATIPLLASRSSGDGQ